MPPAATLTTIAKSEHIHIEKLCPLCIILPILFQRLHIVFGPVVSGSNDVFINSKPAARVTDVGVAVPCCNSNTYMILKGSSTVYINGLPAARIGDPTLHCSIYPGQLESNGSTNVNIGDSASMGFGFPGLSSTPKDSIDTSGHSPADGASRESTAGPHADDQVDASVDPTVAKWRLIFDDGQVVRGALSDFHGGSGRNARLRSEEGLHIIDNLEKHSFYGVDLSGTETLRGTIVDHGGEPIAGAVIHVSRSFGDAEEIVCRSDGSFELSGLLKEEPCSVSILRGKHARGRFVDEDGHGLPGTQAVLHLADGTRAAITADSDGWFEHQTAVSGEGFGLEVLQFPARAKGRFIDENGRPLAGVRLIIRRHDGREVEVVTDGSGSFNADELHPGEQYSIEIVNVESLHK